MILNDDIFTIWDRILKYSIQFELIEQMLQDIYLLQHWETIEVSDIPIQIRAHRTVRLRVVIEYGSGNQLCLGKAVYNGQAHVCFARKISKTQYKWGMPLCGPFYYHGLTSISAWISNTIRLQVWYEITYAFPNLNGCTVEVWEWIINFIPHFIPHVITHPCWD